MQILLLILLPIGIILFWVITLTCTRLGVSSTEVQHEAPDSAEPGSVAENEVDAMSSLLAQGVESETLHHPETEAPQQHARSPRTPKINIVGARNRQGTRRPVASLLHAGAPRSTHLRMRPKSSNSSSSSSSSSWEWGSSPTLHSRLGGILRTGIDPRRGSELGATNDQVASEDSNAVFTMSL